MQGSCQEESVSQGEGRGEEVESPLCKSYGDIGWPPADVLQASAKLEDRGLAKIRWVEENWIEVEGGGWTRGLCLKYFFLLVAAWVRSRAERPSVSYTKVTAISQGQAISCKYTTKTFKQISGSNKFLIAGDGKMKRMREP